MRPAQSLCIAAVLAAAAVAVQAQWVGPAQVVRFAPERDYGPFVFQRSDGRIDGLSVEILTLLQQRVGMTITTLPARPLNEQLQALRAREADLVSSLRATPERGEYALFTLPYVSVPAVVVLRTDQSDRPLSAMAGEAVAVGQGYAVEPVMRQRYPKVAWQGVSDDGAALRGLAQRRFEAAVVDAASFVHVSRELRLEGLRIAGPADFDYPLSFAVRKDWPELRDALDVAIRALPREQRQAVLHRWLGEPVLPQRAPWATRIGWMLLALGVLAALLAGVHRWRQHTRGRGA